MGGPGKEQQIIVMFFYAKEMLSWFSCYVTPAVLSFNVTGQYVRIQSQNTAKDCMVLNYSVLSCCRCVCFCSSNDVICYWLQLVPVQWRSLFHKICNMIGYALSNHVMISVTWRL